MKVMLLGDASSPHVQSWVRALAPELSSLCVFSFTEPADAWHRSLANVEVASMKLSGASIGRSSLDPRKVRYLFARRELKRLADRFGPDLVHAHFATSYGFAGARLDRHPLVVSAWGSDVLRFPKRSWVHRRLLRYTLAAADGVLATSRALSDALAAYTSAEVTVIPFGVDVQRFSPRPGERDPRRPFTLGVVKHLEPEYGIDVLIRAFAHLRRTAQTETEAETELQLVVAGEGSERERLRALADSLGVSDAVELSGRIDHESVPDFLGRCDVLVNPSRSESFGVSVLEASACGLPVVASAVGGLVEIVEHERSGLLVPPEDELALANAIRRLVRDPVLRAELGAEARRRVAARYDLRRVAGEMLRYYRRALSR